MQQPPPSQPPRAEQIRATVESVLRRRAAGEVVEDGHVIAQHSHLLPELARELALLAILERARTGSRSRDRSGQRSAESSIPAAPAGYSFIREVHRGGQGVVFEGVQNGTGRRVAIKLRRGGVLADDREVERFEREVEILAQLEHPNIVRIVDTGVREAEPFFVMDFVDGAPLDEYVAARTLSVDELIAIFRLVVAAVNAAHLRGVVHRDLKPANILVDNAGVPHLLDFGLARLADPSDQNGPTLTGQFIGSVPWASPEQAEGVSANIDLRTDVYSLGVILFHILTGAMPYDCRGSLPEIISVIRNTQPARPSAIRRSVDADLDTITLKCLAKEPQRRYQSASELLEDLNRWSEHRPIAARPPSAIYQIRLFARRNRAVFAGAVCVALALVLGFAATLRQLRQTHLAERAAARARDSAEKQAYASSMAAAEAAFTSSDSAGLKDWLEAAPERLRGWEWRQAKLRAADTSTALAAPEGCGHTCALAVVPGEMILCGFDNEQICAWDAAGEKVLWKATIDESPFWGLLASARRRFTIAVGLTRATLLSNQDGSVLKQFTIYREGGPGGVSHGVQEMPHSSSACALSDDGTLLAIGQEAKSINIIEIDSGRVLAKILLEEAPNGAAFSADGSLLAISERAHLTLVNVATHERLNRWSTPSAELSSQMVPLEFTKDARFLVGGFASYLIAYEVPGGAARLYHRSGLLILRLAIDQTSARVAATTNAGNILLYDLSGSLSHQTFMGGERSGSGVAFLDSTRLVTTTRFGTAPAIWDIRNRPSFQVVNGAGFLKCGFSADSNSLRVASAGELIVRDLKTRSETRAKLPAGIKRLRALDRSGTLAAALNTENHLCMLNTDSGAVLWTEPKSAEGMLVAAFSSDQADVLCSADRSGTATLRHARSGEVIRTFPAADCVGVAVSADGGKAAWIAPDGTAAVIDVKDGREVRLPQAMNAAWSISLSMDGRMVAWGGNGKVCVHRLDASGPAITISIGDANATALTLSPDATRLACTGHTGVRIYETDGGMLVGSFSENELGINSAVWSNDGRYLAAAGGSSNSESQVIVWDSQLPSPQHPDANAATKSR